MVKIGGPSGIDYTHFAKSVAHYAREKPIVVVHGAHAELDRLSIALNHAPQTIISESGIESRYSDAKTMEYFLMAYCGKANKQLVGLLQAHGVNAIGLSGMDGGIAFAQRKDILRVRDNGKIKVLRGDYSGKIIRVQTTLLSQLVENGYVPVLCPPALGEQGIPINVDGDRLAGEIAASMHANELIILSNTPGLLEKFPDENTLLRQISHSEMEPFLEMAQGRMKRKLMAAREAIEKGVGKVILGDGRVENSIQHALEGNGTVIE